MGSSVLQSRNGEAVFFDDTTTERAIEALVALARSNAHSMTASLSEWLEWWIDMPVGCKTFRNGLNVSSTFTVEECSQVAELLGQLLESSALDDLAHGAAADLKRVFGGSP